MSIHSYNGFFSVETIGLLSLLCCLAIPGQAIGSGANDVWALVAELREGRISFEKFVAEVEKGGRLAEPGARMHLYEELGQSEITEWRRFAIVMSMKECKIPVSERRVELPQLPPYRQDELILEKVCSMIDRAAFIDYVWLDNLKKNIDEQCMLVKRICMLSTDRPDEIDEGLLVETVGSSQFRFAVKSALGLLGARATVASKQVLLGLLKEKKGKDWAEIKKMTREILERRFQIRVPPDEDTTPTKKDTRLNRTISPPELGNKDKGGFVGSGRGHSKSFQYRTGAKRFFGTAVGRALAFAAIGVVSCIGAIVVERKIRRWSDKRRTDPVNRSGARFR